jgi:hypothetical protein
MCNYKYNEYKLFYNILIKIKVKNMDSHPLSNYILKLVKICEI